MLAKDRKTSHGASVGKVIVTVAVTLSAVGSGTLYAKSRSAAAPQVRMIYTSAGFGGWVPDRPANESASPLAPIQALYDSGKYAEAETAAQALISRDERSEDNATRHRVVEAWDILAYSAARRGDFSAARDRFSFVRDAARRLPDHGSQANTPGDPQPTLEEEGAFQHAVCVGALKDRPAAESEYRDFLKDYPESILVQAAVKRIAWMHGGDLPRDAEALRKKSMAVQAAAAAKERREEALCGPECIVELLRRQGKTVDAHLLADAMSTGEQGTSLEAMSRKARELGLPHTGMRLTDTDLIRAKMPAIALVDPGHYVLLEHADGNGVTVWDPDLKATGVGGLKRYTPAQWQRAWNGIALIQQ